MTVYYEKRIGEGEIIPSLPENEPERYMLLSGGGTRTTLYLLRGEPGNEYFRYFPISAEGSGELQTDGGTSAQWGPGFWKSARRDGKYILVTDNVNSTSPFPFRPFKRSSDGQGYYYEYLGDASIEAPPTNRQWQYMEYNPVYNEIIVSADWLIYEDNDDDTFTLATGTYFDTNPLGSGNRQRRGQLFSPDGELFVSNSSGGNSLQFYKRSTTGARYQHQQSITGIGSTNSTSIVYDPARDQVLVCVNDATRTIKVFEEVSGTWTQVEDLAVNNPSWNGTGANQIANNFDKIYITEDGEYLIVSVNGATADGHFIFDRTGSQWTLTTTKLANIPASTSGQSLGFGQIPGTDIVFAGTSIGPTPITFMNINGGGFTEIPNSNRPVFGAVQATSKAFQAGSTQTFEIAGSNIVTNSYDRIFVPRDPYMYQSFDYHKTASGGTISSDTSQGALVHHPYGDHRFRSAAIAFSNAKDTGALFNQPGPLPNSFCTILGTDTYFKSPTPDPDNYIQSNLTTGAMVAVIKTPPAWWTDNNDLTVSGSSPYGRHVFSYGNSGASSSSNRLVSLSLVTDGSVGKAAIMFRAGSGNANWAKYFSDTNLALDSWYVIVVNQFADGNGPQLWLNGNKSTLTKILGDLVDTWLAGVNINKQLSIGPNPSESASYRKPVDGLGVAAAALFETPLSNSNIRQLTGSFNLLEI
jgi:hypothetical protein